MNYQQRYFSMSQYIRKNIIHSVRTKEKENSIYAFAKIGGINVSQHTTQNSNVWNVSTTRNLKSLLMTFEQNYSIREGPWIGK